MKKQLARFLAIVMLLSSMPAALGEEVTEAPEVEKIDVIEEVIETPREEAEEVIPDRKSVV